MNEDNRYGESDYEETQSNGRENSLEDFKKRVAQLEKKIKEKEKNEQ